MAIFGTGELWGDGAAAGQLLTEALAPGAGGPVEIEGETELICLATVDVDDNAEIEFRLDWHPTAAGVVLAADRIQLPVVARAPDGIEYQRTQLVRIPGVVGTHPVVFHVPYRGFIAVQARAIGLGPGSTLYLEGFARPVIAGRDGASGGLTERRLVVLSGPTSIVDDGAVPPAVPAPVPLTSAYTGPGGATDSDWIDLESGCTELALILDTSVATPTTVDLELLWSTELAAAVPSTYFIAPVVNHVVSGTETLAPRQTSWQGRASAALPVGPPGYREVYERPPEARSYCARLKRGSVVAVEAQLWATQLG